MNGMIIVPLNKQGIKDYEEDVTKTENLREFELPEYEYLYLFKSGFFERLNQAFDLMIDEFENEIIENVMLAETRSILFELEYYNAPVFLEALDFAIEKGTEICLEL